MGNWIESNIKQAKQTNPHPKKKQQQKPLNSPSPSPPLLIPIIPLPLPIPLPLYSIQNPETMKAQAASYDPPKDWSLIDDRWQMRSEVLV